MTQNSFAYDLKSNETVTNEDIEINENTPWLNNNHTACRILSPLVPTPLVSELRCSFHDLVREVNVDRHLELPDLCKLYLRHAFLNSF
jgi:hypothetical protein